MAHFKLVVVAFVAMLAPTTATAEGWDETFSAAALKPWLGEVAAIMVYGAGEQGPDLRAAALAARMGLIDAGLSPVLDDTDTLPHLLAGLGDDYLVKLATKRRVTRVVVIRLGSPEMVLVSIYDMTRKQLGGFVARKGIPVVAPEGADKSKPTLVEEPVGVSKGALDAVSKVQKERAPTPTAAPRRRGTRRRRSALRPPAGVPEYAHLTGLNPTPGNRKLSYGLFFGGIAGLGAGSALMLAAVDHDAETIRDEPMFYSGVVIASVGTIASIVGGFLIPEWKWPGGSRWADAEHEDDTELSVGFAPTSDGFVGAVAGRF